MPRGKVVPKDAIKDEAERAFARVDHEALWRSRNGVTVDALTQVKNEERRILENIARQPADHERRDRDGKA